MIVRFLLMFIPKPHDHPGLEDIVDNTALQHLPEIPFKFLGKPMGDGRCQAFFLAGNYRRRQAAQGDPL